MARRPLLLALLLCIASPLSASADPVDRVEARAAAARMRQELLPALDARRQAAEARQVAAAAWFDGDGSIEESFVHLVGRPLLDPTWLTAHGLTLQERARARAAERVAPLPPALGADPAARLSAARSAALDAEDAADAVEARFIAGLQSGIERAPALDGRALDAQLDALQAERLALGEPVAGTEDAEALAARIEALGEAESGLRRLGAATVRALTVPRDDQLALLAAADRQRLGADLEDPHARDRLRRCVPLLDAADRAATLALIHAAERQSLERSRDALTDRKAALQARLEDVEAADLTEGVEVYEEQLAQASQARVEAEAAPAPDADPDLPAALRDLRAEVRGLGVEVATLEEDGARRRVQRARRLAELGLSAGAVTEKDIEGAEAKAAEAAALLEEAKRNAQQADRLVAEALAASSEAGVTQVQDEQRRQEAVDAEASGFDARFQALQAEREDALALPPLASERVERLARVWATNDQLVGELRAVLLARYAECDRVAELDRELLARTPDVPSDVRAQADPGLVEQLDAERAELSRRATGRTAACRLAVIWAMERLERAKTSRRIIESSAPAAVGRTADGFVLELISEVRAIPARARGTAWQLRQLRPSRLSIEDQLGELFAWAMRSLEVLLVFAAWLLVRRRIPTASADATRWLAQGRRPLATLGLGGSLESYGVPGDWARMRAPLIPVARASVDAGAALLVFLLLQERGPILALPVLIWSGVRLVAAVPGGLGLLLTPTGSGRPALRQVEPAVHALATSTARLVTTWWVTVNILQFGALGLLDADRIGDLFGLVMLLVGVVGVGVLLARWWEPARQEAAAGADSRLTPILSRDLQSSILRAAVTTLALALLLWRSVGHLVSRAVRSRIGLAWVSAALARQRLRDADPADERPPLPDPARQALLTLDHTTIDFTPEVDAVRAAWREWMAERRRGMAAVIGAHGSGKSRVLKDFRESLPDGTPVLTLSAPRDATELEPAMRWLGKALGVPLSPDLADSALAAALAEGLAQQEPRVILIDDAHRFFLRAVGGFRALRRVLSVMHTTSQRHFWVCSFHGPAWFFLEGVAQAVNLAVFRQRVVIRPMDVQRLSAWLEGWTQDNGWAPDYDPITPDAAPDPKRAEDRARAAYWLLLAKESAGNPRVALRYWVDGLRSGGPEGTAAVTLFRCPRPEAIDDASDRDLFVLTALAIHDELGIAELARTLNLPPGICRATCRHLEALGILESDRDRQTYRIDDSWLPLVGRTLRDKQFLHGR